MRRDWRRWKSARRIESPSSSGLISRALRIRTLSEQYCLEIRSWTVWRRITRWSGGGRDGFCQTIQVGVRKSESSMGGVVGKQHLGDVLQRDGDAFGELDQADDLRF